MSVKTSLTNLADEIRRFSGETRKMSIDAMANDIPNVYAAGVFLGEKNEYDRFWDGFQQNGKKVNYRYAFSGTGWTLKTLKIKYPIKIVDAAVTTRNAIGMFMYFNMLNKGNVADFTEICKMFDFSECKAATNLFSNAVIDNITADFSNAERMDGTFNGADGGGGYIKNITLTVSEKCTDYIGCFSYQSNLTNLIFTDGSVIAADVSFAQSKSLSDESVQSIINALGAVETAKKVTFHTDVLLRLTEEQYVQIANKNWRVG
jgi:hypothetical protein